MRLESEHAVAAGQPEEVVQTLERLLVHCLVVWRPLHRADQAFDQVDQHFLRRTDDHTAERSPADRHKFRWMDKRADVPTRHGEAAKHAANYNNDANDNDHGESIHGERKSTVRTFGELASTGYTPSR